MTTTTPIAFDLNKVELSSTVTVGLYREMEGKKDRIGLANFIAQRLSERYIDPPQTSSRKHGFLMMAAACLLIETLESFYRGWETSDRGIPRLDIQDRCKPINPRRSTVSSGEVAFCYFFYRERAFAAFRPYAADFYRCVRCGILHQGETTGGWRIRRKKDLFDVPNLTINANEFLVEVKRALLAYAARLRKASWDEDVWKNFRKKMDGIIDHCKPRCSR